MTFERCMTKKIWLGEKKKVNMSYRKFKVASGVLKGIYICEEPYSFQISFEGIVEKDDFSDVWLLRIHSSLK